MWRTKASLEDPFARRFARPVIFLSVPHRVWVWEALIESRSRTTRLLRVFFLSCSFFRRRRSVVLAVGRSVFDWSVCQSDDQSVGFVFPRLSRVNKQGFTAALFSPPRIGPIRRSIGRSAGRWADRLVNESVGVIFSRLPTHPEQGRGEGGAPYFYKALEWALSAMKGA